MKLNNLTKGAITFSVLSMLASGALVASAASNDQTGAANATSSVNATARNHGHKGAPKNLTAAQKAQMAAKKAEMDTKLAAVKAALAASDYNAWVSAETAINAKSPLLSKITADNFSKYVQAYNLRVQADAIMKDLGFDQPGMGAGFGPGTGEGFGHGLEKAQE